MEATERDEDRCTWLVEGWPIDAPEGWYPDSPSDLIRECGARVTSTDEGWECAAGHSHFHDAEYFDDEEIAGMAQRGIVPPANARRIDGRTL
jgi:hypothetical protein